MRQPTKAVVKSRYLCNLPGNVTSASKGIRDGEPYIEPTQHNTTIDVV